MTYSSFNSHSDPLFKSLKIKKIEDILNLTTAVDMYVNIKFDKENSKNPTNNKLQYHYIIFTNTIHDLRLMNNIMYNP